MRRMLDPTKVGGLPSTIEFDKEGNRTAEKNLGVNGKLTLKSLVSASNPDGDITKELGSGGGGGDSKALYHHHVSIFYKESPMDYEFEFDYNSYDDIKSKNIAQLKSAIAGHKYTCSGVSINSGSSIISLATSISESNNLLNVHYINLSTGRKENQEINEIFNVIDKVNPVD